MKNKAILVSFIALFAIVFALSTVMASEYSVDYIDKIDDVRVNDVSVVYSDSFAGDVSEVVPVVVKFTASDDVTDVRVKVYIEGYRDEISATTERFHIVDGKSYIKEFSLRLPSSDDLNEAWEDDEFDLNEDLNLVVRVSAKGEDSLEREYSIGMQKNLYSLDFRSIESPASVLPGSSFAVDVVLENNGFEWLDDTYVKVSIPELGIERNAYFGDLSPFREDDYNDIRDTVNKKVYLVIPRDTVPGVYDLEIEAYNYDESVSAKKRIVVNDVETGVIPTITSRTIAVGEETRFNLVLVNTHDRMVVYTITPEESMGLIVEVTEPVVTIPADSSKTVGVKVKSTASVEEGTHVVTVNANSESGLVKKVDFTVNVEKPTRQGDTVVVLTVILAIVFVVLLIILIVLLTKRPEEPEEFGETNYY